MPTLHVLRDIDLRGCVAQHRPHRFHTVVVVFVLVPQECSFSPVSMVEDAEEPYTIELIPGVIDEQQSSANPDFAEVLTDLLVEYRYRHDTMGWRLPEINKEAIFFSDSIQSSNTTIGGASSSSSSSSGCNTSINTVDCKRSSTSSNSSGVAKTLSVKTEVLEGRLERLSQRLAVKMSDTEQAGDVEMASAVGVDEESQAKVVPQPVIVPPPPRPRVVHPPAIV